VGDLRQVVRLSSDAAAVVDVLATAEAPAISGIKRKEKPMYREERDTAALVEALLYLEYNKALDRVIARPQVHEPTFPEMRVALAMAKAEALEAVFSGWREVA
jgi:hypothetical protein